MDTSKEYIKMCEGAVDVQELWKPKERDCFYWKTSKEILYVGSYQNPEYELGKDEIFIPRQDQLQEMIEGAGTGVNLVRVFDNWIKENLPFNGEIIYSMEQLWLAFVMSEKFDKIWDGSEWVDAKNNQVDKEE